jgi:hypothetical protein
MGALRIGTWLQMFTMILALFGCTAAATAQGRAEGSIAGTVTDETKALLPGVTVTATNPATGFTRETVTDGRGAFNLPALAPGMYDLTAMLTGFGSYRRSVTVTVGSEVTLEVSLGVASVAETVTVTGEAPLIEISRTEQGTTLNENEVRNLPINSRAFTDFALLAPGVIPYRTGGAGPGAGGGGFSTSGNRSEQNAMNIDGMANKEYDNASEAGNFSQEAVQEFQVLTQSFPAEFGHAAGGVINAVTKSGTNQFSGYGFFFLRHNAFDKPPFNLDTNADGTVTAVAEEEANEFQRRIAGLTIGGPLKRNKAFFFFVLDRTDSNTPRVRTIRESTLETVKRLAIPNLPDNESNRVSQFKPTSTKASLKVDVNFSERLTGSARASTAGNFSPSGTANGRNSVSLGNESQSNHYLASASLNYVPSSRLLNTFRFNYSKISDHTRYPQRGGIENYLNMDPGIIIGGGAGGNFGGGDSATISPRYYEDKYELQNTVTFFRNSHTVKGGFYYQAVPIYQSFMFYTLGVWHFADINAFNAGVPSMFRQSFGPAASAMVTHMVSGFAQDEWKPTAGLTFNVGLRYEVNLRSDPTDFELPEPALNPDTGQFDVTRNGSGYMQPFQADRNNIMPRVGVSYTPDAGTTVFRAGGGVFYGIHQMSAVTQGIQWTSPLYGQFVFPSRDALPLWQALRDPASPTYNNGLLRLSQDTLHAFRAAGRPVTQQTYPSDINEPRSFQASAGVERQLASWLSAQGTFLWSKGAFNVRNANINLRGPMFFTQGSVLPSGTVAPYDLHFAGGERPDPSREEFNSYLHIGNIEYTGVSGALTARWPGLQLRGTYSHNSTWDDAISTNSRLQPAFQPDPECANFGGECEWSQSVVSTSHRVNLSAVYQVPQTWPVYARDWQFSAIGSIESGHPFVVQSGFDFNNDVVLTDRPRGVTRTGLWTDGFNTLDLRVARFIPLGGRVRAEAIFEMFNVFNSASYSNYVNSLYVFNRARGGYVPRPDFEAFHDSGQLNERDLTRTYEDIGLDQKLRRDDVADPFQGQFALRIHF